METGRHLVKISYLTGTSLRPHFIDFHFGTLLYSAKAGNQTNPERIFLKKFQGAITIILSDGAMVCSLMTMISITLAAMNPRLQ